MAQTILTIKPIHKMNNKIIIAIVAVACIATFLATKYFSPGANQKLDNYKIKADKTAEKHWQHVADSLQSAKDSALKIADFYQTQAHDLAQQNMVLKSKAAVDEFNYDTTPITSLGKISKCDTVIKDLHKIIQKNEAEISKKDTAYQSKSFAFADCEAQRNAIKNQLADAKDEAETYRKQANRTKRKLIGSKLVTIGSLALNAFLTFKLFTK